MATLTNEYKMREKRIGHLVDGNEREQSLEIPGLVSLKLTTFTHLQIIKQICYQIHKQLLGELLNSE